MKTLSVCRKSCVAHPTGPGFGWCDLTGWPRNSTGTVHVHWLKRGFINTGKIRNPRRFGLPIHTSITRAVLGQGRDSASPNMLFGLLGLSRGDWCGSALRFGGVTVQRFLAREAQLVRLRRLACSLRLDWALIDTISGGRCAWPVKIGPRPAPWLPQMFPARRSPLHTPRADSTLRFAGRASESCGSPPDGALRERVNAVTTRAVLNDVRRTHIISVSFPTAHRSTTSFRFSA